MSKPIPMQEPEQVIESEEQKPETPAVSLQTPTLGVDGKRYGKNSFSDDLIPLCDYDLASGGKCKNFCKGTTSYCSRHIDLVSVDKKGMENLSVSLDLEIKALKIFLGKLTQVVKDPKILNRVNDLINNVGILDEKIKGLVIREQFKQVGFYFSSILFKYIENGTRYELARAEFLECLRNIGAYSEKEIQDEMVKK